MSALLRRHSIYAGLAALLLAVSACAADEEPIEQDILLGDPDLPMDIKTDTLNWKVEDAIRSSCTTASIAGLAEQLIDELECMQPGVIDRIDDLPGVTLTAATRPYLQGKAAISLAAAGRQTPITLTSGLRTLPQQFLLYQWYVRGLCRGMVSLAARPGRSNHESGLAIDVSNYSAARSALTARSFRWFGSGDRVHFDYMGGTDLRSLSVRAFQRLWNLNNESAPIGVDGAYGPQTEGAIKKSPAGGFATSSTCAGTARVTIDVEWTHLGGDLVALRASAPTEIREIEFWVGGELVTTAESEGGRFVAVVEVGADGPQLFEAVGRDASGRLVGRGLDYLEVAPLSYVGQAVGG